MSRPSACPSALTQQSNVRAGRNRNEISIGGCWSCGFDRTKIVLGLAFRLPLSWAEMRVFPRVQFSSRLCCGRLRRELPGCPSAADRRSGCPMPGRPGEQSRPSDLNCFTRRCQWPLSGLVIIEACPRPPHERCTPTSTFTSLHVHHAGPRGSVASREPRISKVEPQSRQQERAARQAVPGLPLAPGRLPGVAAGWAPVGPVQWSTATSPLMRCLPGVRT